jgi:glycosyltransferase involved in cell wall biosynthesis
VADRGLPTFDLVVATVDRVDELRALFDSLAGQTHRGFRVLLVDQNGDDRIGRVARDYAFEIVRVRSTRGLSRARNAALDRLVGELVAFPDDDCVYAADFLERVAERFAREPGLDGLTARAVGEGGDSSTSWRRDPAILDRGNLWNRAISFTIVLRRRVVTEVGEFDERLGLGSGEPWSAGEETDYLVRAVDAGARIEYDPELVVSHPSKPLTPTALRSVGARDGASLGYILRKHRYPTRTVARMLVRPAGGALLALARLDAAQARFHLSTLRGRLFGYRAA